MFHCWPGMGPAITREYFAAGGVHCPGLTQPAPAAIPTTATSMSLAIASPPARRLSPLPKEAINRERDRENFRSTYIARGLRPLLTKHGFLWNELGAQIAVQK